ncbi:MAG: hypothetical protein NTZ18_03745 [Candidatus Komeilibacteria bacterium]|nr:hypothetical protein [Candidatus Komeilibacteria bacterium]
MQISEEKITDIVRMTKELEDLEYLASEGLRTVQDQHGQDEVELEREGRPIKLKEKILWDEVFVLGEDSDAGKTLKRKYKDVFDAFRKQGEKANELQAYIMRNFGIDYKKMKFSDYIKLIRGLIQFELKQEGLINREGESKK